MPLTYGQSRLGRGMVMAHIDRLLRSYIVEHDIRETTVNYYHRIVSVYKSWCASKRRRFIFTARTVSQFLYEMQQEGKTAYYRRSLRNGLIALLRFYGDDGSVRPVKIYQLELHAWFPHEVARLVACSCGVPPVADESYWPTIIQAAYYTGLAQSDLERLERRNVSQAGVTVIRRSRTGKRSITWMPSELLITRPSTGPLWPRDVSAETFRKRFKRIVTAADLRGTFKTLRKTSGTEFDLLYPGKGHEHLANTRAVFDRHYNAQRISSPPFRLPLLPDTG